MRYFGLSLGFLLLSNLACADFDPQVGPPDPCAWSEASTGYPEGLSYPLASPPSSWPDGGCSDAGRSPSKEGGRDAITGDAADGHTTPSSRSDAGGDSTSADAQVDAWK
jgi:hypothetical protein